MHFHLQLHIKHANIVSVIKEVIMTPYKIYLVFILLYPQVITSEINVLVQLSASEF